MNNLKAKQNGDVAGMLLYAKTNEQIHPNNSYTISGNRIMVTTLDLNLPFTAIAEQLEAIANEYFCVGMEKTG